MLRIYGSELCPDCMVFKAGLDAAGAAYEFVNITGSMKNLKEFLKIRDADPIFDNARENGSVGIPAFLREDGNLSLDWESYLKENGISSDPALKPGAACRIDGSGC